MYLVCINCGGTMIGDGYTEVYHCEFVDISSCSYEPDDGPIYCGKELKLFELKETTNGM